MDVLTAQIITMLALFFTMIISCFLPFFLVKTFSKNKATRFEGSRYELCISFANCFSGGVFIATFFVGLLPHVREEFEEVLKSSHTETHFPVTEFVVFLGFFLALLIEHVTLMHQEKKKGKPVSKAKVAANGSARPNGMEMSPLGSPNHQNARQDVEIDDHHSDDDDQNRHDTVPNFHGHTHDHAGHSHDSHGHSHDISKIISKDRGQDTGLRFYILVLSLSVHSIFEGMALGLQSHMSDLLNLFVGVIIHECLVAFAMGVSLSRIKPSVGIMLRFSVIFSIMIPVGQALGLLVGNQQSFSGRVSGAVLQGIAAGTFIHVTFLEVIPSELYHRKYILVKIFFIFLGFLLIVGSIFAMGHHHSAPSFDLDSNNSTDAHEMHHHHR